MGNSLRIEFTDSLLALLIEHYTTERNLYLKLGFKKALWIPFKTNNKISSK